MLKLVIFLFFWVGSALVQIIFAQEETDQTIAICEAVKEGKKWIVPGNDGWLIAAEDVDTPVRVGEVISYYQRLNELLKSQGVTLIMLVNPRRAMVSDAVLDRSEPKVAGYDVEVARAAYYEVLQDLQVAGILAPDMLAVAQSLPVSEGYFFKRDHHWTPEGARAAAKAVAEVVKTQSNYVNLNHVAFTTIHQGSIASTGGWGSEVEKRCKSEMPTEEMTVYTTESSVQEGLFDDKPSADVVLLGTSFSQPGRDPGFNFEGFLKEALSLDVFNMAVTAGGPFTAIQNYFLSPEFQEHKPHFLIWELTVADNPTFVDDRIYRAIIPSLYGGCEKSLYEQTAPVSPELTLLKNTQLLPIRGSNYYLSLTFSDITLVDFNLIFNYPDGLRDSLNIQRSTRVVNDGIFYVELDETAEPLQNILLRLPKEASGTVTARVCEIS